MVSSHSTAKEVFLAVRELESTARAEYLSAHCSHDPTLRRRVEALLRAETALGPDLLSPAPSVPSAAEEIDRYELLDVLGEGGFGTVYRARRRGGVSTEVALKVLRAGLDSQEALTRFKLEQQALEAMDHPGIARVLDAGQTRTGRPYLVMELVRGEPITQFCNRAGLGVAERLGLMTEVCRAVQHAHSKGVIHRDLKPSNILAWSSQDQPDRVWTKVIDFGVAKAMNQDAVNPHVTLGARAIGTPAYMSPEQARAGEIDTRSDVYSLGAVLYELLCGQPVLDAAALISASPGEVERLIVEVDPVLPSVRLGRSADATATVRRQRQIRGELDWITLKALAKDPSRRYPTAQSLADDLERVGRSEPVSAAPPSRWYRLRRGMQRNRVWVAAAALSVTALLVGAGVALREADRAHRAQERAQAEQHIAQTISTFLESDLLGSLEPNRSLTGGGGRDVMMREVMDKASRRLAAASAPGGSLERESLVRSRLHAAFSGTYFSLGSLKAAEAHARSGLDAAMELEPEGRGVVTARVQLGRVLLSSLRYDEAIEQLQQAVELSHRTLATSDQDRLSAELFLGVGFSNSNRDIEQARELFRACYDTLTSTAGRDDPQTLFAGYLLAHTLLKLGDLEGGERLQSSIYELRRRVLGERDVNTLWSKLELARAKIRRGGDSVQPGMRMLEEVLADRAEIEGPDHFDTLETREELADLHLQHRDLARAKVNFQQLYDYWLHAGGPDHPRTLHAQSALGETLARLGDYRAGMPLMTDALDRTERLTTPPYDANWIRWRVDAARRAERQGSWEGIE